MESIGIDWEFILTIISACFPCFVIVYMVQSCIESKETERLWIGWTSSFPNSIPVEFYTLCLFKVIKLLFTVTFTGDLNDSGLNKMRRFDRRNNMELWFNFP